VTEPTGGAFEDVGTFDIQRRECIGLRNRVGAVSRAFTSAAHTGGESVPIDWLMCGLKKNRRREDRERLSKLRIALRISPDDAVWDVMGQATNSSSVTSRLRHGRCS